MKYVKWTAGYKLLILLVVASGVSVSMAHACPKGEKQECTQHCAMRGECGACIEFERDTNKCLRRAEDCCTWERQCVCVPDDSGDDENLRQGLDEQIIKPVVPGFDVFQLPKGSPVDPNGGVSLPPLVKPN